MFQSVRKDYFWHTKYCGADLIALKVQVYIILIFWMLLQLKLRTANAERAQWRWDQDSGRNMEQWQVNTGREGTQPPPAAQPGTVSTVSCVQPRVTWVSVSVWRWPALHNNVDNSVKRQITCSLQPVADSASAQQQWLPPCQRARGDQRRRDVGPPASAPRRPRPPPAAEDRVPAPLLHPAAASSLNTSPAISTSSFIHS